MLAKAPAVLLPPLAQVFRSFLERPELCQHARRLRLDSDGGFNNTFTSMDSELTDLPISALPLELSPTRIQGTIAPDAPLWVEDLHAGDADALVALLVSTLPT